MISTVNIEKYRAVNFIVRNILNGNTFHIRSVLAQARTGTPRIFHFKPSLDALSVRSDVISSIQILSFSASPSNATTPPPSMEPREKIQGSLLPRVQKNAEHCYLHPCLPTSLPASLPPPHATVFSVPASQPPSLPASTLEHGHATPGAPPRVPRSQETASP